ncbi:hypothetical protein [Streptomyces synnematoformans]|uniref:Uncharacterized protein n=1 Tax=Streptomyces synnematoformans TaxID=415721 RepID=A0ABN2XCK2_9ACTN
MTEPTRATIPLHVVAVEVDGGQLDCCDDDPVHVWVSVTAWSGRRAVLVQGTQFATAAGCPPADLPGKFFLAELDLQNPPPFEAEPGERIDFPGLRPAPDPPAEWLGTRPRQTEGGPAGAAPELRAAARRLRSGMLIVRADLDVLLAAWLESVAERHFADDVTVTYPEHREYQVCRCSGVHDADEVPWPCPDVEHALAVARAIGGGAP